MPYTTYYLDTEGQLHHEVSNEEIRRALETKAGVLWVDIQEPTRRAPSCWPMPTSTGR